MCVWFFFFLLVHPTCEVMAACSSLEVDLMPCCVMKVFRMPVSVFCGYPKSRSSAKKGGHLELDSKNITHVVERSLSPSSSS